MCFSAGLILGSSLADSGPPVAFHTTKSIPSPILRQQSNLRGTNNSARNNTWSKSSLSAPSTSKLQSFRFDDGHYAHIDGRVDRNNIVIATWLHLDPIFDEMKTIRTILSTKGAGCEPNTPNLYGFSVSINDWELGDGRIHIELGDEMSGCHKVDSGSHVYITSGHWHHIAVVLAGDGKVTIFVNGTVVSEVDAPHHIISDARRKVVIGRYADGTYPLFGNLSHLSFTEIVSPRIPSSFITHLWRGKLPQSFLDTNLNSEDVIPKAFFPFNDSNPGSGTVLKDLIGGFLGEYVSTAARDSSDRDPAKLQEVFDVLVDGLNEPLTRPRSADIASTRLKSIRDAMSFIWKNYREHAWGYDELKPVTRRGQNNWGGMGVTLVDSLDTLWIMGLKDEFYSARNWVRDSLKFDSVGTVSVFETTIRELGGLLAAYDLSKDQAFLTASKDLGHRLVRAFDTSSGIPLSRVDMKRHHGASFGGGRAVLSELGSLQVEFRYLAQATGEKDFEAASMRCLQLLNKKMPKSGLFPIHVDIRTGTPADKIITLGALGDSFYEYLLKLWLQGRRKETWLRKMYDQSVNGIVAHLLKFSRPSGLAYLGDFDGRSTKNKMDHLVCFLPGTLALGAYTDPDGLDSARARRDLTLAKALMYTCVQMYMKMPSGISGEYVEFGSSGHDFESPPRVHFYILRPETAESLYILHYLTGDEHYREWAWDIWQHIDRHCKTKGGYGALRNVYKPSEGVDDRMESFFLAETLKYLYLIQEEPNDRTIDLMGVVFNTEAHPLSLLQPGHKPIMAE